MNLPDDASEVEGVWSMVRAEMDGVAAPELVARNLTLELACGEYRVRLNDETTDSGTFELGGTRNGQTMLLRGSEGPNSGRTIPCIYQITGDRLRVCYSFDGAMPTEFMTTGKRLRYLATYRRREGKT